MAINFPITGDNSNFISAMNGVRSSVTSTMKQVEQAGGSIETMFNRLQTAAAGIAAGFSVKEFAQKAMTIRGQFQQLEVAFKTMLGSEEKATNLMNQLVKTAATTPFDLQGVANGAKQLMAYGTAAEDVNEMLVRLGDIAAGMSIPLGDLVYLYGTTMTQGRMFTQDLRQFQGRGIPIADEIAKILGITKSAVGEAVTAGKVTDQVLQQAIVNMTSYGSQFGGLMDAQSKTINGQISNIQDSIDMMFNEIGKSQEGVINKGLDTVSYLVEHYETVGKVLIDLVAAYGAYKAALIATAAVEGAKQNYTASLELQGLQEEIDKYYALLPAKEQAANADLQEAVAKNQLTQAQAQLIAEKREELALLEAQQAQRVGSAQTTVSTFSADLDAAKQRLALAAEEHMQTQISLSMAKEAKQVADQRVTSAERYIEQLHLMADAEGVAFEDMDGSAAAMSELNTAQTEALAAAKQYEAAAEAENSAATAVNTAEKNVNTAQQRLNTAQEELNTVSRGQNTAATVTNTAATGASTVAEKLHTISLKATTAATAVFTAAMNGAKNALNMMKVAIMTNPLGVLIGALTIVIPLLYQFFGGEEDATDKANRFGESADEAASKVETLSTVLKNTSSNSKIHRDAMQELAGVYKEYGVALDETIMKGDDEIAKKDELIKKEKELIDVIRTEAIERQAAEDISSAQTKYTENLTGIKDEIKNNLSNSFDEGVKNVIASSIDDAYIERLAEAMSHYNEVMKNANSTAAERREALLALKSVEGEITSLVEAQGKEFGLSTTEIKNSKLAITDQTNALTENKFEYDSNVDAVNRAREVSLQHTDALSGNTQQLRMNRKSLTEIKQELDEIARRNNILIDINIRYNELNQMPEALKNFSSKQWQARAASYTALANKHKNGATIYDKSTKQKRFMSNEELLTQARLAANEGTAAQEREAQEQRDREAAAREAKSNARKAASAAKSAKAEADRQKKEAAERAARQVQLDREVAEKAAESRRDAENAAAEASIASIQDKNEREMAQEEYDHQKRIQEIEQQAEEMKKARYEANKKQWELNNKDGHYETDTAEGKAGWQAVSLSSDESSQIQSQLAAENAEYARAAQERAQNLIDAHQSYTDKKLQLDQQYSETVKQINQAIYEAEVRGETDTVEALKRARAQAAVDHSKDQSALSLDTLKASPEYTRAFEDLQKTSTDTLEYLIEEFEKAKDAAAESLDPKDLKEYTDTIQKMKDEVNARDPFKSLAQSTEKLNNAQKKVKAAKERLNLIKKKVKITKTLRKEGDKLVSVYYTEEDAQKDLREAEDKEMEAQEEVNEKKKATQDAVLNLADSISNLGNQIGGTAGEILNLIGNIMSTTIASIQAVEMMSAAGATAMKTIESASAILAIIGAAIQIFTALFALFSKGDGYEEAKAQYDELLDIWDEMIDKKKEYLEQSWGEEVKGAREEAEALLETMRTETKLMALKVLDVDNGGHSMRHRMWQGSYSSERSLNKGAVNAGIEDVLGSYQGTIAWGNVNRAIEQGLAAAGLGNVTFDKMEDLLDMNKQQLEWIRENYTGLWANMDGDFREYLERLMEYTDSEAEILEQAKEQITGISFESVFDDFMDSLYDIANGSEDVFEDIEKSYQEMMNKMLINNVIGTKIKQNLEAWYDKWYSSFYDDGMMSDAEIEALKSEYDSILSDASDQIEMMREQGLIVATEESEEEAKEYFSDIRDSWLDTLTDMEASAEDFEAEIARIMTEDLVNSFVLDDEFEKWLADWKERYAKAIEAGDTAALDSLREEQMNRREELAEEAKQYADATGYSDLVKKTESEVTDMFQNLHSNFLDALMDVNTDAEAWGSEIAKTIARQIVEEQLLNSAFDGVLDEWKKSVNEIMETGSITDPNTIEQLKDKTAEMKDTLSGLAPEVQEFLRAIGAVQDEVENLNTSFTSLSTTISSSLTDLTKTSEDFARSINETMTKEMIEQLIKSKYEDQLDSITKRWQDALLNGDTSAMSSIKDDLVAIHDAASESMQPLIDGLKEIEESADTTITGMKNQWSSSLSDMTATTKDFADDLRKTIAQKMIDTFVLGDIDEWLKEFQDDYNAVMSDTEKSAERKRKEVGEMLDVWISKYEELRPLAEDIMESFGLEDEQTESVFDNLRDSLLSVLTDMEKDAEDFAEDISKTMAKAMIDKYVLGEKYDDWFNSWQKRYEGYLDEDMTEEDRQAALKKLIKEAKDYANSLGAEAETWLSAFDQDTAEDQDVTMNMAEAATYDQFETYLGIAMAQQMCQEQQKMIQQQILSTLQMMGGITNPSSDSLTEMRNLMMTGNEYLLDIKRSNREILATFGARLEQINNNLNRL